ncbi:MAG TPA: hypothetical protein VLZ53_02320, partial [Devosia sp.]|nr:hypothetical protein [Devosia sp.]
AFPGITGWEVTAGRWRYDSATGWVRGAADEPRTYAVDGVQIGYLMEGAETFYSAPWHDSDAGHSASDPTYLAKSLGSDTVAYAGSHSQPDIHGGTGKGVELTQGVTANGTFTANNVVCATAGASDIIRAEFLISIPVTTGLGGNPWRPHRWAVRHSADGPVDPELRCGRRYYGLEHGH